MQMLPSQVKTLKIAAADPDGRVMVFDPNDGPLTVLGLPGEGPVELGMANLQDLVHGGFLRREGASSYLITRIGRAAIEA